MMRPSIFGDVRGTSFVELGLILPIFMTMLLGVVDLSRAFSMKLQLEQAAQRAVERVQRENYDTDQEATIQAEAANGAGVATSAVTIDAWLECNGSKVAFNGTCSAGQTMARYVTVKVQKNYTPLLSMKYLGGGSSLLLQNEAGIRVQ